MTPNGKKTIVIFCSVGNGGHLNSDDPTRACQVVCVRD